MSPSTGPQAILANLRWSDGLEAVFKVAGDAFCVDTHILKWHPLAKPCSALSYRYTSGGRGDVTDQ